MSATFRATAERLCDYLISCSRLAPNGSEIGFPRIRNRDECVDVFRDFWRAMQQNSRLFVEVQKLTFEDLVGNGKTNSRLTSPPAIVSERVEGWLFLRQAAGDFADAEAAHWGEWIRAEGKSLYSSAEGRTQSDREKTEEVARRCEDLANVPFVQPTLERAVLQAYDRGEFFTCQFKAMVVALKWLIAVDQDLETNRTDYPTDESAGMHVIADELTIPLPAPSGNPVEGCGNSNEPYEKFPLVDSGPADGPGKPGGRQLRRKPRRRISARAFVLVEQAVRNYHKFDGGLIDDRLPPISGMKLRSLLWRWQSGSS